ncbi:hypothetical protein LguiB_032335 [Lonicera macranthoides]
MLTSTRDREVLNECKWDAKKTMWKYSRYMQLQVALAAHNMNSRDLWTRSIFIAFQESCKWLPSFAQDENLLMDGREDYFRMKHEVKMNKILTCYCDQKVSDYSSTRFLIEGGFFPHNKTPDEDGRKDYYRMRRKVEMNKLHGK